MGTPNPYAFIKPEDVIVVRRTFEALNHEKGSPERTALNRDPATSEFMPSYKYLVRFPAFMADGTANPLQKFINRTCLSKKEAEILARTIRHEALKCA